MRVIADRQPLLSYLVLHHGMTIEEFAKQAEVNPNVIYKILKRNAINSKSLSKITKIIPELAENIQPVLKE